MSDVTGMEGATVQLNELFAFDYNAGLDPNGRHRGLLVPTGIRPTFEGKIRKFGVELTADSFRDGALARRAISR